MQAPSLNYQQQFAPVGPGYMTGPAYMAGGDQMMSSAPPGMYQRRRRYGQRRIDNFIPYLEQMQPFAGVG
jgi:hypothetical protein